MEWFNLTEFMSSKLSQCFNAVTLAMGSLAELEQSLLWIETAILIDELKSKLCHSLRSFIGPKLKQHILVNTIIFLKNPNSPFLRKGV